MNGIKPLPGWVLVRIVERKTMHEGLFIPDSARALPGRGKVLAIGEGVTEIKRGDSIVFEELEAKTLSGEFDGLAMVPAENVLGCFVEG